MKAFSFIAYMIFIIAEMNAHVCNNQSDGCCQDFQLKDGICEPCFGSWGINCTQNCTPGYYGFGCRSRCLCHPYQLCDKIFGCRDNLSKDKEKATRSLLCDILLVTSVSTSSLCLLFIFYILSKRFCNIKKRENRSTLHLKEKDVNVEQPSSDPQGCLLQNCMHIINNQPPSSYGYAMFTKSTTRLMGKSDGTTAVPIHVTETALNYPKDFPESVSVHSQFYDKCQRTSDEYLPMEMSVTLSNRPNRSSYFEQ
ncbi:uncharacterized protein LOC144625377 [Crassostrea virginica]